jgi:pyrroloquinoline quinone (PQQ) biosynthesis protein C
MSMAGDLLALAAKRPAKSLPVVREIADGIASPLLVALYARRLVALAVDFPRRLNGVMAVAPPSVTASLRANLAEETGAAGGESHQAMAQALVDAFPAEQSRLAQDDDFRIGSDWLGAEIAAGRWLGPAAAVMVGAEHNSMRTCAVLAKPLRTHYGLSAADVRFVTAHIEADARHSAEGAALLVPFAVDEDSHRQIREGVRHGVLHWFRFHLDCAADARRLEAAG